MGKFEPKYNITKEFLEEHYVNKQMSSPECARLIGCTYPIIITALKKYGIEIRPSGPICPKLTREWLAEHYVNQGLNTWECAEKFGCSQNHIRVSLKRFSITPRASGRPKPKVELTEQWLTENYVERGLTSTECAELAGCSHHPILSALKRYGITPKPAGMPLTDISKEWLTENYCKKALSMEQCATMKNCSVSTIQYAIKRHKIESHSNSRPLERNPQWKGGISFLPYCRHFNDDIKEQVRESFSRKCYICGKSETNRKLDVHHCDFNKNQGCAGARAWKLIPLCRSCHAKTTVNKHFAFALLANYWAEKYVDALTSI